MLTNEVKCDEVRPECTNCIRHSVECQYALHPRGATPAGPVGLTTPGVSDSDKEKKKREYPFISSFQPQFIVPKRHGRGPQSELEQLSASSQSASTELSPSSDQEAALIQRPFQFTANDMALFHHCMSTPELKAHLPDELIRLGFSVHYVLHLLLAISGFHLKRKPGVSRIENFIGQEVDTFAEAERHLNNSISQLAAVDPQLHAENGHVIYIASLFIFICSLARGPQPGEYMAFRTDDDIPAVSLFMSMRSILEANNNLGTSGAISEVQPQAQQRIDMHEEYPPELTDNLPAHNDMGYESEETSDHYSEHLAKLRTLVLNTFPATDARCSAFTQALELLWERYNVVFDPINPILESELWPQIFSWLYLLPNIVSSEMQQRNPVALVLFSYFAVLLQELDSVWFIQGWPSHIVIGVSNNLDIFHVQFIAWPRRKLGLS